ncbi:MAG: VapE family protein [Bacteroidota bacterium]|nr:VapE family protein [Bacteroidota bacterium]
MAKITNLELIENEISNKYDLRLNKVNLKIEAKLKSESEYKPFNENNLWRELQKEGYSISINNLRIILQSEFVKEFNPFEHFFENQKQYNPSKEPDYINQLSEFITTDNSERFKRHFKKMIVRSIACALVDNYCNKHCFVLVGGDKQNQGKSTFWRWLFKSIFLNYYTEDFSFDKDGSIALGQNFAINLDELANIPKDDMKQIKGILSKDFINARLPYAAKAAQFPRRANFVATTNETEFLKDETGNVRWLCFNVLDINFDYDKKIDIKRVWAQAYYLFKNHFKYQLTHAEVLENEECNKQFMVVSNEMEIVTKYFENGTKIDYDEFMTTTEMINELRRIGESVSKSVNIFGKEIKKIGFKKVSLRDDKVKNYAEQGFFVKYKELYNEVKIKVNISTF